MPPKISRRKFIESHGATCQNWTWSWSFINEARKQIIFGAWDVYKTDTRALILSEDWQIGPNGKKSSGYKQSRSHIDLVQNSGYELLTFPIIHAAANPKAINSPSKIKDFSPVLSRATLLQVGNSWYAHIGGAIVPLAEEVDPSEALIEGAAVSVVINAYERNPVARAKCLAHHGYTCAACGFDFGMVYGQLGAGYIHVHHLVPVSSKGGAYIVDPLNDLVPVCANCHAVIHKVKPALTIAALKELIAAGPHAI